MASPLSRFARAHPRLPARWSGDTGHLSAWESSEQCGTEWERWFVDVEETRGSLPALVFFRSPQPDHNWVTAAGAVLDSAALTLSTVEWPRDVQAEFCLRAGYLCLRRIAGLFKVPFDPDPTPDDPISISREEWQAVVDALKEHGVPLKADLDQAWRDFSGWRVNYDAVLLALANIVSAPCSAVVLRLVPGTERAPRGRSAWAHANDGHRRRRGSVRYDEEMPAPTDWVLPVACPSDLARIHHRMPGFVESGVDERCTASIVNCT